MELGGGGVEAAEDQEAAETRYEFGRRELYLLTRIPVDSAAEETAR